MTNSPQQQLFLDLFRKALSRLDEDDASGALGALLDVRENGFVNRELDAHIGQLRDTPSRDAMAAARGWVCEVIDRLRTYEGDVFQLVEALSEVSLAAADDDDDDWIPLEHDAVFDDPMLSMELESFDDFDDFDDADFEFEPTGAQAHGESAPEPDGFDLPGDFELDAPDSPIDRLEMIEGLDELDDLGELDQVDDFDDFDALGDLDAFDDLEEIGDFDDLGGLNSPESLSDGLSELTAGLDEQPGSGDAQDIDFALVEKTKNIDQPVPQKEPSRGDIPDSDGALGALFDDDLAGFDDDLAGFDDDLAGFDDDLAEASKPGRTPAPSPLRETARQTSVDQQAARQRMNEPDESADDDLDFDFDLGFKKPTVDEVEPQGAAGRAGESSDEGEDEDDDFDFDLGFENPAHKSIGPEDAGAGAAPQESGGWGTGFDFGFDDDSFGDLEAEPDPPAAGESGREITQAADATGPRRELDLTPTGMPAVSRFGTPEPPPSGPLDQGESTQPRQDAPHPREEPDAALDDEEFFGLAESLAGDSSASSFQSAPQTSRARYRGEPLMGAARGHTPVPPEPASTHELSEVSEARQRRDTPNPFAHQAPTGVQKALVDSQSSFVLEEIRASEVHEDQSAVTALMQEARRLYEDGKFESAHDLLLALMVRDDVNEEAHELLAAVDGELERVYQTRLGSLSKIPTLSVAMNELASMNLDHRFGYLLSQIDGMSSFEDILELSSMSRLETLDVLVQMLSREIIAVS